MRRRALLVVIVLFLLSFGLFLWNCTNAKAENIHANCRGTELHLPRDKARLLDSLAVVQNREEIGSGVIVSPDGYLLTAAHVVGSARQVAVYLNSGDVVTGQVLQVDEAKDAALVKIPGHSLPCRPLQTRLPSSGTDVYGAGLTLQSQRVAYQMTEGQVTDASDNRLQTNADLPMGNSGGPFLNGRGEVLGLISWKKQPLSLDFFGPDSGKNGKNVRSSGASALSLQRMLHAFLSRH